MTVRNLGVITTIHVSNVVETDKGNRFIKTGPNVSRGDVLIAIDDGEHSGCRKRIVPKEEYEKSYRKFESKGVKDA